ncbi:MAG: cupin domain-containing protein [Gracilimonas sp.]|uniref:cupin domain-containing protein n=1 Tax=Gracilimonas TaxID=649462 RepID=UPI001B0B994F|nr:cupin domain-containing protein [Gracilimonas sp.]MBO6587382.1 cupin domain-containing protein [Gracilimonas sp.]MBO6614132.1 cupin domain-containing protein [Gracilimonas sp.]
MSTIEKLITRFDLQKHPEGGYFKETYRSEGVIPETVFPDLFEGSRNYCTGIYFLLTSDTFSAFHRIRQDEMWHFYQGSPLTIHMISPDGNYSKQVVGSDFDNGELPQFTVPKEYWFAAEVNQADSYSFVGCTVSPGFDFQDFELAAEESLSRKFSKHKDLISRLTRG